MQKIIIVGCLLALVGVPAPLCCCCCCYRHCRKEDVVRRERGFSQERAEAVTPLAWAQGRAEAALLILVIVFPLLVDACVVSMTLVQSAADEGVWGGSSGSSAAAGGCGGDDGSAAALGPPRSIRR